MKVGNYFKEAFVYDLKAGFITAVVALPLALAFAIASGVPPIMGLYTAVIAGILGSGLAGSPYSITGPTGAMTVIILSTVSKFGLEGLLVAGLLAGIFQIIMGVVKLGRLVKYIPFPIVSGFTAGIGAIIFIGQIANSLGLSLPAKEHVWQTISQIINNLSGVQITAITIAIATVLALVFLPRYLVKIPIVKFFPASFFALVGSTLIAYIFSLPIPLVGDIPSGFPAFHLFNINFELIKAVTPAAFTIALLGAIEALLCAVVCDSMTNTRHKSDKELISQGVCNTLLPFFGAIPCTAAIARSAVNIREGAKTRGAGIIHGIILLIIILFLVPIAKFIPKAFLAGILMFVSARMINLHEFKTVERVNKSDTFVLLVTFLLTVFTDLVFAVEVGMFLAVFLLFIRLTKIAGISAMEDYKPNSGLNKLVYSSKKMKELVSVYTLHGPFFFGAMGIFEKKISEQMETAKPVIILRMKHVTFIDSTGVVQLVEFIKHRQKNKRLVLLTGLEPKVKEVLLRNHEFRTHLKPEQMFTHTTQAVNFIQRKYTL